MQRKQMEKKRKTIFYGGEGEQECKMNTSSLTKQDSKKDDKRNKIKTKHENVEKNLRKKKINGITESVWTVKKTQSRQGND